MGEAEPERVARLKAFGIPAYAIRAYLALLDLGVGTAREVREIARVPPAKIYGTLDQLQRRGLAEVIAGKPRTYRPVPMEAFVARELQEHQAKLDELATSRDALVQLFPVVGTAEVGRRSEITSLRGRRNVSEHFRELVNGAKREMMIVLPAAAASRLRSLETHTRAAQARGVAVRFLARDTSPTDARGAGEDASRRELHVDPLPWASPDVAIGTFDGETALLAHFSPVAAGRRGTDETALVIREPVIVRALASLLRDRWEHAAHADAALAQGAAPADLVALLDGLDEPIIVADAAGSVRLWNRCAARALGWTVAEARAASLDRLLPGLRDAACRGEPDVWLPHAGGGTARYSLAASRVERADGSASWLYRLGATTAAAGARVDVPIKVGPP